MFFSLSFLRRFCPPFQSSYPSFWYCLSFLTPYSCSCVPLLHAFCLVLQIKCRNLTVLLFTFRNGLWFFYWIFCIKLCSLICKPEKRKGGKKVKEIPNCLEGAHMEQRGLSVCWLHSTVSCWAAWELFLLALMLPKRHASVEALKPKTIVTWFRTIPNELLRDKKHYLCRYHLARYFYAVHVFCCEFLQIIYNYRLPEIKCALCSQTCQCKRALTFR